VTRETRVRRGLNLKCEVLVRTYGTDYNMRHIAAHHALPVLYYNTLLPSAPRAPTPLSPFTLYISIRCVRCLLALRLGLACGEHRLQASVPIVEAGLARQPAALRARPHALCRQVDAGKLG